MRSGRAEETARCVTSLFLRQSAFIAAPVRLCDQGLPTIVHFSLKITSLITAIFFLLIERPQSVGSDLQLDSESLTNSAEDALNGQATRFCLVTLL